MNREQILEEKLLKCQAIIADNLSEFITLNKLIKKSTIDVDNIEYITSKGSSFIKDFIDNFNIEPEVILDSVNTAVIADTNFTKNYNIKDIKTYQDVINVLPENETILPYPNYSNPREISINAYTKLINITKVFNEGWQPDWDNSNERKYYPWFYMDNKGGGFQLYVVGYLASDSFVSARLCFKTEELAKLSVDLFLDIYKEYFEYK